MYVRARERERESVCVCVEGLCHSLTLSMCIIRGVYVGCASIQTTVQTATQSSTLHNIIISGIFYTLSNSLVSTQSGVIAYFSTYHVCTRSDGLLLSG